MNIKISQFGKSITTSAAAEKIFDQISKSLKESESRVVVDFSDVFAITTSCAKLVFGKLYNTLGSAEFSRRLTIANADKDIQIIIHEGIVDYISNEQENSSSCG